MIVMLGEVCFVPKPVIGFNLFFALESGWGIIGIYVVTEHRFVLNQSM